MQRRLLLLGGALLATAAAGVLTGDGQGSQSARAAEQPRPNVVVIMTDDQTVESLRVMPNVRRLLAEEGTTFTSSFATYSLCCPSRATFLTGQYPHHHGVMSNRPPEGGFDKLNHRNVLPVWLRRAGYATVHIGKYLNGYTADDGVPRGWTEWFGAVDPSTYRFYGYTLNENGRLVTYGAGVADYQTDVYTQKAVDVVRRRAPGGPFFLSVAYLAPHSGKPLESGDPPGFSTPAPAPRHQNAFPSEPLPASPSFNEADVSDKPSFIRSRPPLGPADVAAITENYRQRLESLLAVDEGVAAIVRALQESGELERTLIIFTSDNGFFHGEHRVKTGKVLLYEPSIRVPLIVRGPSVPRNRTLPNIVGNIDLAPTIVDAASARAGLRMDGSSLLPLLGNPSRAWRDAIVVENLRSRGLRTAQFLYAQHPGGERELYDLSRDPDELVNVAADPAFEATRRELGRRLVNLLDDCPRDGPCPALSALRLVLTPLARSDRATCFRAGFRAKVEGTNVDRVDWVEFVADDRVVAVDRSEPFEVTVKRVGAGRRDLPVQARVVFEDRRVTILTAALPACRR